MVPNSTVLVEADKRISMLFDSYFILGLNRKTGNSNIRSSWFNILPLIPEERFFNIMPCFRMECNFCSPSPRHKICYEEIDCIPTID